MRIRQFATHPGAQTLGPGQSGDAVDATLSSREPVKFEFPEHIDVRSALVASWSGQFGGPDDLDQHLHLVRLLPPQAKDTVVWDFNYYALILTHVDGKLIAWVPPAGEYAPSAETSN